MTFNIDRFLLNAAERVVRLPELFARWDSLDPELQEEYADQIERMLDMLDEAQAIAPSERWSDVIGRILIIRTALQPLRKDLESRVGVTPGPHLETLSVRDEETSATPDNDSSCTALAA